MAQDKIGRVLDLGDYALIKVRIVEIREDRDIFNVKVMPTEGKHMEMPVCPIHSCWLEKVDFGLQSPLDELIS